jgi:tetratricopeptide (TPR) repeat protein
VLLSRKPAADGSGTQTGAIYILGPARSLLSQSLYERADVYFHRGAEHTHKEAFHGFFQKWKDSVCPTLHAHAQGREIQEILPWLRLATKSDPHNIEIYLVASFWLNGDCNRPDLAKEAIKEAMEQNPDRYELHQEMGRLHLDSSQPEAALDSLETALDILQNIEQTDQEQASIDLLFNHTARSYLYEALGNKEKTIEAIHEYLELKPNALFAERLKRLESGELDPEAAKTLLKRHFYKTHECERDDHDDEHVHGPDCNH